MVTQVKTVNELAYTVVLTGPGIITLKTPGMVRLHVADIAAVPLVGIDAWHPLAHGVDHQYSYSGTETTFARNDLAGSLDLIVTPLL